jgi:hypothetical protein
MFFNVRKVLTTQPETKYITTSTSTITAMIMIASFFAAIENRPSVRFAANSYRCTSVGEGFSLSLDWALTPLHSPGFY